MTPSTTSAATTSASTPTPSPAPTVLTKKQAAARYLELDRPYRLARQRLLKDLDGTISYPKIRRDGLATEKALAAKIAGILDTRWPSDVVKYANDYASKAAVAVDTFRAVSKAHDLSDLLSSGSESSKRTINGAESLLRIKLGLPQAI